MNKKSRRLLFLALACVLSLSLAVSAGAESLTDLILRTGTTQSFTMDAVPDEDIQTILQAGISTASAINQQPWYFVAITNQELMKEIGGSGMGFSGRPDGAPAGAEGMPPAGEKPEGGAGEGERPAMPAGGAGGAKASLGDSPLAIIIYMNEASKSPSPNYDCGLASQNMVLAASALGYGVKIVSSPTMSLNGENHDQVCERLGVDTGLKAVAVLLIGKAEESADAVSSASVRDSLESKSVIIH